MKWHVLVVCAMLALVSGVAHAYSWAHISNISSTLGLQSNRLCVGVPSSLHVDDMGCPTYSPYLTSGGLLGIGMSSPTATLQVSGSFIVSSTGQTGSPSLYVGTDGKVGIGTSAPSGSLHVVPASAAFRGDADVQVSKLSNGNPTLDIWTAGSGMLRLSTGETFTRPVAGFGSLPALESRYGGLLITSSGEYLSSDDTANGGPLIFVAPTSSSVGTGFIDFRLSDYTSDTSVMRIISGSVGIGITSPNANLEVSGTVSATHFVGDGSGLTGIGGGSGDAITSGTTNVTVNSATSTISFTTNGSVANYFNSAGDLIAHGISVTTNTLSATAGYFSGNVGIGTSSPATALDVYNGDIRHGNTFVHSLTRAMPTNIGNYIEIGNFTFTNGGGSLWISIVVPSSAYSVAKEYLIPIQYNQTNNVWQMVLPVANTGPYGSYDFALDINVNGNVAYLRLRDSSGFQPGTAYVTIRQEGINTDTFTPTSATGTNTPSAFFGSTPLTQVSGSVGIGMTNPTTALEVSGTVSATHFVGDGSGLTGVGSGDRITSGTASVIATQDTGAEVSGTLKLTNTGSEPCDPAHYNALRVDPTTHSIEICLP